MKLKSRFALIWVLAGLLIVPVLAAAADTETGEFSMKIMDVISFGGHGIMLTGQVKSGSAVAGVTVCSPLKNGESAARVVDTIYRGTKIIDRAENGQIAGLMVSIDEKLVEKGALLHSNCELKEVPE